MEIEFYQSNFKSYPKPIGQELWVSDYEEMITHTRGERPMRLIDKKRPNELDEVKDYRVDNFRCITRDPFTRAITNLQRTLSHSSVEIYYPEKLRDYLEQTIFMDTNFLSLMQKHAVKRMIEAANGLLVWWPTGQQIGEDVTREIDVMPIFLSPKDIIHYDREVLTFLSDEKSDVLFNGTMQKIGNVYYVMLDTGLFKRRQIGKKVDERYEWIPYYANPFGEVYALPLGGDEVSRCDLSQKDKPEISYFTSYFSSAVPFADECLCQFSDHQGVLVQCSSPIREIERIECTYCKNGYVDYEGKRTACHVCNGSTFMPLASSPYQYLVRPDRKKLDGVDQTDIPMMRFLNPDVDILEFGAKTAYDLLERVEKALHLLFIQESQSGVAKEIDREDKLSMLDKVGLHLYKYLITQSIQIIHKFKFPGDDFPQVSINLPPTFVTQTTAEIIEDLGNLRLKGAPDVLILQTLMEVMNKKFGGDPVRMKIFNVNMVLDPLITNTLSEKSGMLTAAAITARDWTISKYAPFYIQKYAIENADTFLDTEIDAIIAVILPQIEERVVEPVDNGANRF